MKSLLVLSLPAIARPSARLYHLRQAPPGPSRPLPAPTVGGQLLREAFVLYVLALLEDHDLCH